MTKKVDNKSDIFGSNIDEYLEFDTNYVVNFGNADTGFDNSSGINTVSKSKVTKINNKNIKKNKKNSKKDAVPKEKAKKEQTNSSFSIVNLRDITSDISEKYNIFVTKSDKP